MQNDKTYFEKTSSAYSEILANITTEEEKDLLTTKIEEILSSLYKTNSTDYQKVLTSLDYKVALQIKAVAPQDLKAFLTSLKEKLIATPSVKVTLSFKPSSEFIARLTTLIGGILEIGVDPNILGGIILETNGKYIDLSIKKKLDELI